MVISNTGSSGKRVRWDEMGGKYDCEASDTYQVVACSRTSKTTSAYKEIIKGTELTCMQRWARIGHGNQRRCSYGLLIISRYCVKYNCQMRSEWMCIIICQLPSISICRQLAAGLPARPVGSDNIRPPRASISSWLQYQGSLNQRRTPRSRLLCRPFSLPCLRLLTSARGFDSIDWQMVG